MPARLLGGIILSPDISRRGLLKWVHPSVCPSVRRQNEMSSLQIQLLLQFLTGLFETLQAFLSWSKDLHLVLGLSCYFFINFFHLVFFSGPMNFFLGLITFRIDTLWAQLLEFSTDRFETIHTCSTWTVGVHVVLGLSSHYFLATFSTFSTKFFPGSICIILDTLWAQIPLDFPPIILKLCILVLHSLKMCMWFWGYPAIIFYQLFIHLRLSFFQVQLILE